MLFGNVAGMQPTPAEFAAALACIPDDVLWSAAGLGDRQNVAQILGIAAGGGVRVGLEDGLHMDRARSKLASNQDLLERVHRQLELADRRWMSPLEFREIVLPA